MIISLYDSYHWLSVPRHPYSSVDGHLGCFLFLLLSLNYIVDRAKNFLVSFHTWSSVHFKMPVSFPIWNSSPFSSHHQLKCGKAGGGASGSKQGTVCPSAPLPPPAPWKVGMGVHVPGRYSFLEFLHPLHSQGWLLWCWEKTSPHTDQGEGQVPIFSFWFYLMPEWFLQIDDVYGI